ncbi:hypothetical protein HAALTHF_53340n [Vreelandella aquamarina]|nr:hypothetical protein HAALTHF_53340n [Halomonas axialensis]
MAIIFMMITAIVMSPIPSGPIAMVAGAIYGPVWGTAYVVIGAEAGALLAFCIARLFGYEVMQRWSRTRPILNWLGKERSQTGLMLIVLHPDWCPSFRLMPSATRQVLHPCPSGAF